MANVSFTDVTRFTAASAGTGSFVVSAAVTGYQTPLTAGASNNNYRYRSESADLSQWEVGTGAYTSSNVTLTRTPIFNSAGGSSAINFTSPPQVAFVFLAEDFNATGQIPGTSTNDSATAGNIGELLSVTVLASAAVSVTTGAATNITSLALTAGNWDLTGTIAFQPSSSGVILGMVTWISSQSATTPTAPNSGAYNALQATFSTGALQAITAGRLTVTLASSATYFLSGVCNFSPGTMTGYGFLGASRRR